MTIGTVGIMSTGEMGAAIGKVLRDNGLDVATCLDRRSELTRLRAQEAGIRDVPSTNDLVRQSDLVISVLVPSETTELAKRIADSVIRIGTRPVFADCNAVAPQTKQRMERITSEVGVTFIDACIIGPPPMTGRSNTRFYCSGPDTSALESLEVKGLDVRVVGSKIGQASGLKMVYAASTKGTTALWAELLIAARALGLDETLKAEFEISRGDVAGAITRQIPRMPRSARRWISEMEEIAATFEGLGMTPNILTGAADMFRFVGGTPLGDQTSREPNPSLDTLLDTLVKHLGKEAGD